MTKPSAVTPLISVLINDRCIGYLIRRGRDGFEAFDSDDRSLGMFADEREAIAAVMRSSAP